MQFLAQVQIRLLQLGIRLPGLDVLSAVDAFVLTTLKGEEYWPDRGFVQARLRVDDARCLLHWFFVRKFFVVHTSSRLVVKGNAASQKCEDNARLAGLKRTKAKDV